MVETVPSNLAIGPNLSQLYLTFPFLRSLVTEIGESEKVTLNYLTLAKVPRVHHQKVGDMEYILPQSLQNFERLN